MLIAKNIYCIGLGSLGDEMGGIRHLLHYSSWVSQLTHLVVKPRSMRSVGVPEVYTKYKSQITIASPRGAVVSMENFPQKKHFKK